MRIKLVYPEKRVVSDTTILGWYRDAVDNGEIPEAEYELGLIEAAQELEDIGHITIGEILYD